MKTTVCHLNTILLSLCFLLSIQAFAQDKPITKQFQHIVDTTSSAHPAATGVMVCVVLPDGKIWTYATGVSDKTTQQKLDANQPVLLASNTKTYVAATILKLQELGKLNIADPIGKYLDTVTVNKLIRSHYRPDQITITHLLSHTGGLNDYANDDYFAFVNEHRQYQWTRTEQVDRAMSITTPLAQPCDTFKYADVDYLLLTQIIEQITHQPFYTAMRNLLRYKDLKLQQTWFTKLEWVPAHTKPLAHQYWNKYPWDSYQLDPSWDLYGGGGMVATGTDVALFFKYLFDAKIITDKNVLAKMYADVPCKTALNYCLGIRKMNIAGHTGYYHGGFWGTDAIYFPDLKMSMFIAVLERSERSISAEICKAFAEVVSQKQVDK